MRRIAFVDAACSLCATADSEVRRLLSHYERGILLPEEAATKVVHVCEDSVAAHDQAEFRQRLRQMFHRRQPVDPEDLVSDLRHPDRSYRRNQWFFHSQDGGGFVDIDPPSDEFSRNNMSDHLRKAYFFGFEFALLQRHALMAMSRQCGG